MITNHNELWVDLEYGEQFNIGDKIILPEYILIANDSKVCRFDELAIVAKDYFGDQIRLTVDHEEWVVAKERMFISKRHAEVLEKYQNGLETGKSGWRALIKVKKILV